MPKTFGRDDILQAKDLRIMHVKAWGGLVCVRGLTGAERDKYEAGILKMRGNQQTYDLQNARAKLCAMAICDESGKRLFTDEEFTLLAEKNAAELQKIFAAAQKLSGITEDDVAELSEGMKRPFEDSASGSPDTSAAQ